LTTKIYDVIIILAIRELDETQAERKSVLTMTSTFNLMQIMLP
jgi:hypothetical protein